MEQERVAQFTRAARVHNRWKRHRTSLSGLAGRVWKDIEDIDLLGRAAQLAFYLLLSLFPALLFLTAIVGLFPSEAFVPELMGYVRTILPSHARSMVDGVFRQIIQGSGKDIVSLGVAGALWAASTGMTAVIETLNAAYRTKETRPLWKVRGIALLLGGKINAAVGGGVRRQSF